MYRSTAVHSARLMPRSMPRSACSVLPRALMRRLTLTLALAVIAKAKKDLETKLGHAFDETFVVGFSSGAYYGSSLAVRSALDVDGYIVLAGGSGWVKDASGKRAPVFVGVSAADPSTAGHS